MEIEFSQAAENDLLDVFMYGIEEHGLAQAERYKSQLNKSLQIISANPKVTRLRYEISPPVRVYSAQKHMIVYTIIEDRQTILVLRLRHQRENWIEQPID